MTTILDVLTDHQVQFRIAGEHHHAREGWIQISCPYCGAGGEGFHMGFNLNYNYTNCWRCGKHPVGEVVQKLTGLNWSDVKTLLGKLDRRISIPKADRPTGKLVLPKHVGPLKRVHREYLEGRGFDVEELERLWEIKGIGIAARLQWRVFIPITLRGETVSWTTRSLVDDGLRYISASVQEEAISHKSLLYGEHYVRHSLIIVEGPTDVWTIGPGCVGTCGIGFLTSQVRRMAKYPVRVVCFDNQPEAQARARELCALLEMYPGETYNVVLDAKDANTAPRREIRRLRRLFLR